MAIAKIKNFIDTGLKNLSGPLERTTANLDPEIGLRIVHSPQEKTLRVVVLGARHLPQNFGLTRVNSYVVKVKIMPGKEKFETSSRNESWPQWNEEFVFNLRKETRGKFGKTKVVEEELGASKFVVATLYAVLEDKPLIATDKKENEREMKAKSMSDAESGKGDRRESKSSKKENIPVKGTTTPTTSDNKESKSNFFNQLFGKSSDKIGESVGTKRKAFENRRTIGATTVSLDPASFVTKPMRPRHAQDMSTGDLWRTLKPIASGIAGAEDRRENKKGQVEVSLCQEKSDRKDISGGRLVLSLLRLRCAIPTMQEHEALKGQLYIKMTVMEKGKIAQFWKSEKFDPCISIRFDQDQARVIANNPYEGSLNNCSFVIKFVSKNKMGKKTTVGMLQLGPDASGAPGEQWKQALSKPGHSAVKWQPFE